MASSNNRKGTLQPPNAAQRFFTLSLDLFMIFTGRTLTYLNPAWERVLGYSIDEFFSIPYIQLIHPDDLQSTLDIIEQGRAGIPILNYENRYRHKDGSYRWLEWTAQYDPEEDTTYCVGRDITARKQAEDARRQSETALKGLLNGMPNLAFMTRMDGTILAINERQAEVFGKSVQELIGQDVKDFLQSDVTTERRKWINTAITSGKQVSFEGSFQGRYFETTISPVNDGEGNIAAVVISNHEITHLKRTEEALRESERTLRQLINGTTDTALLTDLSGRIITLNDRAVYTFHMPESELIHANVYALLLPEEGARHQASVEQVIATGQQQKYVSDYIGHYMQVTHNPIFDQRGQITSIATFVHDITDLKVAETALHESQKATQSLFEAIPDVVFMMTTEGKLLACNQRLADNLGVPTADLIGTNVFETGYGRDPELILEARRGWAQKAIASRQPVQFQDGHAGKHYDHTITPLLNSAGGVVAVVVASHDITHLKRIEEALRKSEEQFRNVLESSAEGIVVTDIVGDIVLVNQSIEKQFGYTREELIGAPVEILLPEMQRKAHIEHRQRYVTEPTVRSMAAGRELVGRRKDGTEFAVDVGLSYTQNAELHVMAFIVDITERKQMEQERLNYEHLQGEVKKERELIELRQRFISMISHEFRTPLAAIAMASELLSHYYARMSEEERIERVRGLNAHVHSMVSLLDDILMLNKIQAGMAELNPEPLDIAALCRRALDTAALIDQEQHQLVFTAEDPPHEVQADRRVLEHILSNLLSNAIKYSPPHTQIDFELSSREDQVTFVIQDQGRGIPAADQPHLFEPFHRALNARDVNGTGLGLAIVKSNVELHGGSIRFHSTEGQGTTFWVELPLG